MSEEHLSSDKLKLEEKEREKTDSEVVESKSVENMARGEQNSNEAQDGADEKMLGSDEKESLALKNIEVKFISADQNTNGDAKIDIENFNKQQAFSGMTKEELMKYANDPYWVRLRWILFTLFWAIWIGMLVGAISIIVYAPKCSAPPPLVWWKEGPIVTITGDESAEEVKAIADFKPKAVIYELPVEDTYLIETPLIQERLVKLVDLYKTNEIHVVIDMTPNIVKDTSEFYRKADNEKDWSSFITNTKRNNWVKVEGEGSAWKDLSRNNFILSQFNDFYDLNMESVAVQNQLTAVIRNLTSIGIKGFRFINAKHFLVDRNFNDELPNTAGEGTKYVTGQYGFYQHHQTTFRTGLGELLHIFSNVVHNATDGEGFLTIRDDVGSRIDSLQIKNSSVIGISIPRLGFINKHLRSSPAENSRFLSKGFESVKSNIDLTSTWMQIPFELQMFKDNSYIGYSAYKIFINLLPGVQISSLKCFKQENDPKIDQILREARESAAFQHGAFEFMTSSNDAAFGYTRVKQGSPGYFVAVNPSDASITANFSNPNLGKELSLLTSSFEEDEDKQKGKISVDSVSLPKKSAAIFTFVPNA